MTHPTATPLPQPLELDPEATRQVGGGMINLRDQSPRPPPIDPGHGGLATPYWDTDGAGRFGAGPWDFGYGSPTGPWPG